MVFPVIRAGVPVLKRNISTPSFFRESVREKIVQIVSNGFAINLYNREKLVFVPVIPLARLLLTVDVFTPIRIKNFGFIPVSPELQSIGIISMDIVL